MFLFLFAFHALIQYRSDTLRTRAYRLARLRSLAELPLLMVIAFCKELNVEYRKGELNQTGTVNKFCQWRHI